MHICTYYLILIFALTYKVSAQNETDVETTTDIITSTYSTSSTSKPNTSCETHDNDCKACIDSPVSCYYCETTKKCHHHWEKVITDGECDMKDAYFLTCKANFKVMVILIGVFSAIPILIILVICCYCCCKKKGIKLSKDDIKWARQREERKQIAAERRKERAERTEEIRKKYGLVKDSNPYQRFDA